MNRIGLGLLAVLALNTGTAFAEPRDGRAFTGMRIEGRVGYQKLSPDLSIDNSVVADESWGGVTYGAAIGADRDFGKIVFGFEVGIDTATGNGDGVIIIYPITLEANRDITFAGRLGYKISPSWLIYGKSGYSFARFQVDSPPDPTARDSSDQNGFLVGGGVEHALPKNFFVKLEYRYSSYSPNGRTLGFNVEGSAKRQQFQMGVGWRF